MLDRNMLKPFLFDEYRPALLLSIVLCLVSLLQYSYALQSLAIACALMLLWGNLHGGVILGQLALVLGALCVGIRSLFCRAQSHFSEHRNLLIFLGLCLIFSFGNPNAVELKQASPTR